MKIIKYLMLLILTSCITTKVLKKTAINNSIVVLQINFKSPLMSGGSLLIRNVNTNDVFEAQFRYTNSDIIVIPNVPAGNYKVEELFVIAGDPSTNFSILSKDSHFNDLTIDESSIYYIGKYTFKKFHLFFS